MRADSHNARGSTPGTNFVPRTLSLTFVAQRIEPTSANLRAWSVFKLGSHNGKIHFNITGLAMVALSGHQKGLQFMNALSLGPSRHQSSCEIPQRLCLL